MYLHYEEAPGQFATRNYGPELFDFILALQAANVWHLLSRYAPWDNPQIDGFSN
jgi:hypothetical protein